MLEHEESLMWDAWGQGTKTDYVTHARHYANFVYTFNLRLRDMKKAKLVPATVPELITWPVEFRGWRIYALHLITFRPGRARLGDGTHRAGLKYSTYVTYKTGIIWYNTEVLGMPWFGNKEPVKRSLRTFNRVLSKFAETDMAQTAPMRDVWLVAMAKVVESSSDDSTRYIYDLQALTMACFAFDHFLRSNEFLPLTARPTLTWAEWAEGSNGSNRIAIVDGKAHKHDPIEFSFHPATSELHNSCRLMRIYRAQLRKINPSLLAPQSPIFPDLAKRPGLCLSKSKFWSRLSRLAARAGIDSVAWGACTPNSFRSGAMTRLMRNGCPINVLKVLGRWKSLACLLYYRPSGHDRMRQKLRWGRSVLPVSL